MRAESVRNDERRFALSLHWQRPTVPRISHARIEEEFAVSRPVGEEKLRVIGKQNLFRAAPIGLLTQQFEAAAPIGHVGDPLANRRPHGIYVRNRTKRETG